MKRILFIFGVLGMVTFANAQISAPAKLTMTSHQTLREAGKQTFRMTGAVEIVFQGGTIKVNADEAFVNRETGVVDLRGNVRLAVPPAMLAR